MDVVFRSLELFVAALGAVGILMIGGALLGLLALRKKRGAPDDEGTLQIVCLTEEKDELKEQLWESVLDKVEFKQRSKLRTKDEKLKAELKKKSSKKEKLDDSEKNKNIVAVPFSELRLDAHGRNIFVIDFDGDISASQAKGLEKQIDGVLLVAEKTDIVVLRLESPGGVVHGYGLAAAQLLRLNDAGIALWICVDKVAASGGYMMACTANRIFAAPFAVLGSIGVVASFPNFNKVLKKVDVDYLELTAGEYKRTLTPFGEITEDKKSKFLLQLEETHTLFKDFVNQHRKNLQLEKIATGEHWYATQCLELGLVDEIKTSGEVVFELTKRNKVYVLKWLEPKDWRKKLGIGIKWLQGMLQAKVKPFGV